MAREQLSPVTPDLFGAARLPAGQRSGQVRPSSNASQPLPQLPSIVRAATMLRLSSRHLTAGTWMPAASGERGCTLPRAGALWLRIPPRRRLRGRVYRRLIRLSGRFKELRALIRKRRLTGFDNRFDGLGAGARTELRWFDARRLLNGGSWQPIWRSHGRRNARLFNGHEAQCFRAPGGNGARS
jgi:hypothetical protein